MTFQENISRAEEYMKSGRVGGVKDPFRALYAAVTHYNLAVKESKQAGVDPSRNPNLKALAGGIREYWRTISSRAVEEVADPLARAEDSVLGELRGKKRFLGIAYKSSSVGRDTIRSLVSAEQRVELSRSFVRQSYEKLKSEGIASGEDEEYLNNTMETLDTRAEEIAKQRGHHADNLKIADERAGTEMEERLKQLREKRRKKR